MQKSSVGIQAEGQDAGQSWLMGIEQRSEVKHFRASQERWRSSGDKMMEDKRKEEIK